MPGSPNHTRGALVPRQRRNYLIDDRVRLRAQLRVGRVLNRMGYEDARRLGQSQSLRLSFGRIDEHVSGYNYSRLAVNFEPDCIVQTARYARPSIG